MRFTFAISEEPMMATQAFLESGVITIPRGYAPSLTRSISRFLLISTTLKSQLHQLLASAKRLSGETALNFGTAPTGITFSIFKLWVLMRYRKLWSCFAAGEHLSLPGFLNPEPYI